MPEEPIQQNTDTVQETQTTDVKTTEETQFKADEFIPIARIGTIYGALPVYSAVPTFTAREGEIVAYWSGTDYRIYTYLNSAWRKTGDAAAVTYISNVVEDTTPQLGGFLDTNGQYISSEGGAIQNHFMTCSLTDNTDIDLFRIQTSGNTAFVANVYYTIYAASGSNGQLRAGLEMFKVVTDSAGSDANAVTNKYNEEVIIGGSWSIAYAVVRTATDDWKLRIKVDSSLNVASTFTARIEIIANKSVTYTEIGA